MDSVDILTEDIVALKAENPRPETPTPIPFKVTDTKPLDVRPDPKPPLATRLPPPAQAPLWTTIVKKGRKTDNITRTTGPPTFAQPPHKKAPTTRERRLIVKREGTPLTMSALDLRHAINKALAGTYVQMVTVKGLTVTLTTMESTKATLLNSRVGSFLHLIPGTVSVHLDMPVTHLLVHGIPTLYSMDDVATELTTFNSGLALAGQPRWLTTEESRVGKSASTVVIAMTGPRAPDFVGRRLAAFSSTYRTEGRLHFNSESQTQCSHCHTFGHHNNKCTNPASCRWCALSHPTGAHTCPTATCRVRGRPCNHTSLKCVNCGSPHEAHALTCPSRPEKVPEGPEEGNEVEMPDT